MREPYEVRAIVYLAPHEVTCFENDLEDAICEDAICPSSVHAGEHDCRLGVFTIVPATDSEDD